MGDKKDRPLTHSNKKSICVMWWCQTATVIRGHSGRTGSMAKSRLLLILVSDLGCRPNLNFYLRGKGIKLSVSFGISAFWECVWLFTESMQALANADLLWVAKKESQGGLSWHPGQGTDRNFASRWPWMSWILFSQLTVNIWGLDSTSQQPQKSNYRVALQLFSR